MSVLDPAGTIRGTGFPEGVRTAPVGITYIDTAATNGAVEWIKASGAGNTGWRVSFGDTGWRNVSADMLNGWTSGTGLQIRRLNDTVFVRCEALSGTSATTDGAYSMPIGFRPTVALRSFIGNDNGSVVRSLYVDGAGNMRVLQYAAVGGYSGEIVIPCSQAWPSTLPGV